MSCINFDEMRLERDFEDEALGNRGLQKLRSQATSIAILGLHFENQKNADIQGLLYIFEKLPTQSKA